MTDPADMMPLGRTSLKQMRAARGLTQQQAAELLGAAQSQVAHWERGTNIPSLRNACRLAALYRVTVDAVATATVDPADLPHQPMPATGQVLFERLVHQADAARSLT